MAAANTYETSYNVTPGAVTNVILEFAAPVGKALELERVEITQEGSTTSAQMAVAFNTATAATTGWTAGTLTPSKLNPSDGAPSATVKGWSSGTSTDGTGVATVRRAGFNVLNGYLYLPVPEERRIIAASGYFVVKFVVAPPAATAFNVIVVHRELG